MLNSTARFLLLGGSLNMALVILFGAFGAHGLKNILSPSMLSIYQTGVHYHALHSLALLVLGGIALTWQSVWLRRTAYLLLTGIILFSGSLYALSISGVHAIGIITPLGGAAFVLAWLLLVFGLWREKLKI